MILKPSAVLGALLCLPIVQASAGSVTMQDMQVVGRAISFVEGPKRQPVALVVVFDRAAPASVREMEAVLEVLRQGAEVGGRSFRAVAVEQTQLGATRPGDAVFSTTGVDQRLLLTFVRQSGMPCFTLDTEQVREGACTVAIRSRPSVNISFSSRNASAAGVSFATAFIMMVREL